MPEIAQTYLGNINHNSELAKLIAVEKHLTVSLQESDRPKGRIHAQTDNGVAVGIIKSRDRTLQSGDIFRTESGKLLLIDLTAQELLVLNLSTLEANTSAATLVYLGHVLGNHHYPMTIQENKIYVQLVTDKSIVEKLIDNLQIVGLQISYQTKAADLEITFSSHSHHRDS